jgi:quercetin dioxygenase-like cupin family protein
MKKLLSTMNTSNPADETEALAPDVLAALAAAHGSEPVPPPVAARIKHRLMDRIARAATAQHLTVHSGADGWQRFQHGVDIKVLNEAEGIMSYLLRLAPGAVVSAHRHPIDEECVVVQGTLLIGNDLEVSAGSFHLAQKNTLHAPISSAEGAIMFIRGATPHPADLV